jgi:hypothetical protein
MGRQCQHLPLANFHLAWPCPALARCVCTPCMLPATNWLTRRMASTGWRPMAGAGLERTPRCLTGGLCQPCSLLAVDESFRLVLLPGKLHNAALYMSAPSDQPAHAVCAGRCSVGFHRPGSVGWLAAIARLQTDAFTRPPNWAAGPSIRGCQRTVIASSLPQSLEDSARL